MPSDIVTRILKKIDRPDLIDVLSDHLSGSELNSVLLEVFSKKVGAVSPPELLNMYQLNRFAKPTDLPTVAMKQMELEILRLFEQHSFQAVELAPVSIIGSCSVVGPADQKKILSALRGTEVLADSTNAIALHLCDLKQRKMISSDVTRICNIQRQVRTQAISGKGFTPHFRIGCLVSCGTDTGAFTFEKTGLDEHMKLMKALFLDYYKMEQISFRLLRRSGYTENFLDVIGDYIRQKNPGTTVTVIDKPEKDNQYYKGIQYKIDIRHVGKTYEIGDGGFVDWTQQLLQNKKERMLSTGFGFDMMYRILRGEL